MSKVAIIMCGLPRTYKETSKNFFSNLIAPNADKYDIDIYLGFWDHTHDRGELGSRSSIRKLDEQEIKSILGIYSPKKYVIFDDYEDKNENYFLDVARKIITTIGFPRHPDGISLIKNGLVAQTYGWSKTFSLLEGDYDIVLKTRFDASMEKINFDEFKINDFNCAGPDHQYYQYELADVLFGGDQKTMEKIMVQFHDDIVNNEIPNISKSYPNVFTEYAIKDFLKRKGISINYLNKEVSILR